MEGQKGANALMLIFAGFCGAVCLAVLAGMTLSGAAVPEKEMPEPVTVVKERGKIYDRNGVLLVGNAEDGREYPQALCPHLLGTLSSDGEARGGVEQACDTELRRGEDVYLTVDSRLQQTAEGILKTAAGRYKSGVDYDTAAPYCGEAGAIVVLDCRDGSILAAASYPDCRLDSFSEDYERLAADPLSPLMDRAMQGLYRPGSTFKTVTALAALNEGAVSPKTKFYCGGSLNVSGARFSCMKQHGYIDISRALELSCNIFFYRTAQRLGTEPLIKTAAEFGFGEVSFAELPTLAGQIASPENNDYWGSGQLVQAAIGQSSTLCTPLQMADAALMLANKGLRFEPRLIASAGERFPEGAALQPRIAAEIKSDKSFELIKKAMTASTAYTYGDCALSKLPSPAAIKTGTPQSPRGYDSAVIGFYPADKPAIAFAVMLEGGANAKHTVYELCSSFEALTK